MLDIPMIEPGYELFLFTEAHGESFDSGLVFAVVRGRHRA
jgi:hypothetical protein